MNRNLIPELLHKHDIQKDPDIYDELHIYLLIDYDSVYVRTYDANNNLTEASSVKFIKIMEFLEELNYLKCCVRVVHSK